jgi:hypothetical protein
MVAKYSIITQEFTAIQTSLEVLEPLNPAQREFAVAMILSRLGMGGSPAMPIGGGGTPLHGASGAGLMVPPAAGVTGLNGMNVKDFMKQKAPATDLERFVCLAYYLTHANDVPSFSTKEITKLNSVAHGEDFSNPAATAMNAVKQSKYLSRAGGGKKRITTRGEAVVEALPDRTKLKEVLAAAPHRGKKRGRPKKAKASK